MGQSIGRQKNTEGGIGLFFHDRLIIGYILEPQENRYMFQLAGGEELAISKDEFLDHWQEYCRFEEERSVAPAEHYRRLPITLEIRKTLNVFPANIDTRRRSHDYYPRKQA